MTKLSAAMLKKGQSAIIAAIQQDELGCRLMTLGLRPGTRLRIVRVAPFGGQGRLVQIGRRCLALRRDELARIECEA